VRLYKDGVQVGTAAAGGTLRAGTGTVRVGAVSGGTSAFVGTLDEVAVYGAALSPAQVASHYALRSGSSTVALQIAANDPDGDTMTYSATGLPTGLAIHPTTGLITGNPLVAGPFTVTVTATDPVGLAASQTFTWTISSTPIANPHRPTVTNPGAQSNPLTESYGYAGAVLAAAPVGYWRMDDAGGTVVSDWAASPHSGTTTGGISRTQAGALADGSVAMRFDGQIGTRVDIADASALELTTAVTVEAWGQRDQPE
jgi:hypothetical protein